MSTTQSERRISVSSSGHLHYLHRSGEGIRARPILRADLEWNDNYITILILQDQKGSAKKQAESLRFVHSSHLALILSNLLLLSSFSPTHTHLLHFSLTMSFIPRVRTSSLSSKLSRFKSNHNNHDDDDDNDNDDVTPPVPLSATTSAFPSTSSTSTSTLNSNPTHFRPQSTPPTLNHLKPITSNSNRQPPPPPQSRRSNSNTSLQFTSIINNASSSSSSSSSSTTSNLPNTLISPIPKRNFNLNNGLDSISNSHPTLSATSSSTSAYSTNSNYNYNSYSSNNNNNHQMNHSIQRSLTPSIVPSVTDAVYSFKLLDALRKGKSLFS